MSMASDVQPTSALLANELHGNAKQENSEQENTPLVSSDTHSHESGYYVIRVVKRVALTVTRACKRRRSNPVPTKPQLEHAHTKPQFDHANRVALPPCASQVLPDFTVRMVAFYLDSVSIAKLVQSDVACNSSLSLSGIVAELMCMRGYKDSEKATSLEQMHLAETFLAGENNINFGFMSTDFDCDSDRVLKHVANLFSQHPSAKGRIETHAQPGAPPAIAKSISEARAQAVRRALIKLGVPECQLRSGSFGTTRPLLAASDGANRRAEIFMIMDGMQFPSEHLPVRVDNSAKWAAWLKSDHSAVLAASDSEEEGDFTVFALRRRMLSRFGAGADVERNEDGVEEQNGEDGSSSSSSSALSEEAGEALDEVASPGN